MKSDFTRISCNIIQAVDKILEDNKMFGNRRKFIELAVMEKIMKIQEKKKK